MRDGDLLAWAAARNTDPSTSHQAAGALNQEGKAWTLSKLVLEAIRASGARGMTGWELCQQTGIEVQTLTPRLAPLQARGLIKDSGLRRPGRTGRKQIVWTYSTDPQPLAWSSSTSSQSLIFSALCSEMDIPTPVCEMRFAEPRRWRFDYAWPHLKVALEVEGGIWTNGRHTRGKGFLGDLEKYNTAALMGWVVLRVEPKKLVTTETATMIQLMLERRRNGKV
jgi:hypothetical protein